MLHHTFLIFSEFKLLISYKLSESFVIMYAFFLELDKWSNYTLLPHAPRYSEKIRWCTNMHWKTVSCVIWMSHPTTGQLPVLLDVWGSKTPKEWRQWRGEFTFCMEIAMQIKPQQMKVNLLLCLNGHKGRKLYHTIKLLN